MHRIDTSTKEVDKFGSGKHGFTEGDPGAGTPATQISDDWLDTQQEELAAIIEADGNERLEKDLNDQIYNNLMKRLGVAPACNVENIANPLTEDLLGIAHDGSGLWVAVGLKDGADGGILTSPDGFNWTEQVNPQNLNLLAVAYSPGLSLWCAVGEAFGDAYIITSPNGTAWTERVNPKAFQLNGVCWDANNGLFVAVGDADGTDPYIVTSPDGITWTERAVTSPKNIQLNAVYANAAGVLVAVGAGDGSDAYIVVSTDGVNWVESANPKNIALYGVCFVPNIYPEGTNYDGLWVAMGDSDGTDTYTITSYNLTSWTEQTTPLNFRIDGIAFDPAGLIVASGWSGGDPIGYYSLDGVRWGAFYFPPIAAAHEARAVGYNPLTGTWIHVGGFDGTDSGIYRSLSRGLI